MLRLEMSRWLGSRNQAKGKKGKYARKDLRCELLEDRRVLAVVSSLADSGAGTLRDALAGADPTITFSVSGTINLTSGELLVNRAVSIDGTGQSITVNNTVAGNRVFNVDDGAAAALAVSMQNFTISGGNLPTDPAPQLGGGVRNAENLTMSNMTVSGNTAGRRGGGIGVTVDGTLNLSNSTVSGNTATLSQGGGVIVYGTATLNNVTIENNSAGTSGGGLTSQTGSNVTVNNSTIRNNVGHYNGGGAVNLSGTLTLNDSTVTGNRLNPDAGAYIYLGAGVSCIGGTTNLNDSTIRANTAQQYMSDGGWGGGISALGGAVVNVQNSTISDNVADRGGGIASRYTDITIYGSSITGNVSTATGGGIRAFKYVGGMGELFETNITIEESTISGNTGNGGGGVASYPYADSAPTANTLTIRNSTLSGNSSAYDGGGVGSNGAVVSIENSTIYGNSSYNNGAGVWGASDTTYTGSTTINFATITNNNGFNGGGMESAGGPFTVTNSIVAGNVAGTGVGPDVNEVAAATITYSLVESTANNNAAAGTGNITGMGADLGSLGANGGATATRMPNATSPVLGAADPASTMGVDQRGFLRPGGNASRDMGSVERDGTSPTLNLDFNLDTLYNCDDMNLLENAIDAGMPIATFDVNQDGMLTSADVTAWLIDAGALRFGTGRRFLPGDANLNGSVDGSDFGIWNANKFTPASFWCLGDFTQTGGVDGSDFGVWNANKFTSSDAGRPASGPAAGVHEGIADRGTQSKVFDNFRNFRRERDLPAETKKLPPAVPQAAPRAIVETAFESDNVPSVPSVPAQVSAASPLAMAKKVSFGGQDRIGANQVAEKARDTVFGEFDAQ